MQKLFKMDNQLHMRLGRDPGRMARAFLFHNISNLYIYSIVAIHATREIQSWAHYLVILNTKEPQEYYKCLQDIEPDIYMHCIFATIQYILPNALHLYLSYYIFKINPNKYLETWLDASGTKLLAETVITPKMAF